MGVWRKLFFFSLFWSRYSLYGQTMDGGNSEFMPLVERLTAFGKRIPQEKVYVHMDNTCYFQGDTIWFAAYTRQTTDDLPSRVSGVLYVELLNNDGYLVERKMIEMREGRGSGFFVLDNVIQYSGFYELRAYTRWQLNWGCYEHKHSRIASRWFASKELEQEYYRDYEKLYSRVFPVYDRPKEAGDYAHDMTMRTMRRYFRKDMDKQEPTLTLFPEGGNLVAGVENRVAFEATMSDGEWLKGKLTPTPNPSRGRGVDSIPALSRGRGVFTMVPEKGMEREVTFTTEDGQTVKAKLPKPEEQGVALQVRQEGDSTRIVLHLAGLSPDSLGLTIMHEGRVALFQLLAKEMTSECVVQNAELECGVNQVTVFDSEGRVWADRLFFVTNPSVVQPTLTVSGIKEDYQPYEEIMLDVQGRTRGGTVSVSVKDANQSDALYDNANIMTEMLLSSEIRGFVPDPGWFFEADDEEHRQALDLLMMTQGWRRFNWRDMAVKGAWDLTQPDEKTPVITGQVIRPSYDLKTEIILKLINPDGTYLQLDDDDVEDVENKDISDMVARKVLETGYIADKAAQQGEKWRSAAKGRGGILVHAEISNLINHESAVAETDTRNGKFKLPLPRYYGPNLFFLSVDDTTAWQGKHKNEWVQRINDDEEFMSPAELAQTYTPPPKYYAHVSWPYPRFVQPYAFYQNHLTERGGSSGSSGQMQADSTRVLGEVAVRARHGGLRRFDDKEPVLVLDAYEAVNAAIDAGLVFCPEPIARTYLGDLGLDVPYAFTEKIEPETGSSETKVSSRIKTRFGLGPTRRALPQYIDIPLDSVYHPKYLTSLSWTFSEMSPGERRDFNALSKLDRIYIYTDYCPRLEGDKRYEASNLPETRLIVYPYPDGSRRAVYRDAKYVIHGFCPPAEFYSPNYSRYKLPEGQKDYRRTLYWNPNLKLDEEGRARVTLYNNSRTTQIQVEAAGQAADGTLLWNR